ncbi:hypothetical protein D3C87_1859780 [compost metagenome]
MDWQQGAVRGNDWFAAVDGTVLLAEAQKSGDQNARRRAACGAGIFRRADPRPAGDDPGAGHSHRV